MYPLNVINHILFTVLLDRTENRITEGGGKQQVTLDNSVLWLVLIFHYAEDRRLSWPKCLDTHRHCIPANGLLSQY